LGKFLFIPVVYRDLLLDGLNGIHDIGDVVTLPEDTFIGNVDEGTKMIGKMTVYQVSSYSLKTVPLTIIQVVLLFILRLFFQAVADKKEGILLKMKVIFKQLEWFTLEATLIDVFFYTTMGLKYQGGFKNTTELWIDRAVSVIILLWATLTLANMYRKIKKLDKFKTVDHLNDFEKEVVTEGIHAEAYNYVQDDDTPIEKQRPNLVLYMNIVFKIKLAIMAMLIVVLQNMARLCLGVLIMI
jgi:hypothetical protein